MARRTQTERVEESARNLREAAVELIAEQGWSRTTAAEIGLRAGYSRAMIGVRYGSKDALLEDMLRRDYELSFTEPDVVGRSGLDQLLDRIDHLQQLLDTDARFMRAMFVLSFEAVSPGTTLRPRTVEWMTAIERALADALETGRADGSVVADIDPPEEARSIMDTAIGISYRWTLMPGAVSIRDEVARWRRRLESQYANPGSTRG